MVAGKANSWEKVQNLMMDSSKANARLDASPKSRGVSLDGMGLHLEKS